MLTTEDPPRRDDSPRIAFLHLLMFFTLWIWAAALSAILRDSADRIFSVSRLDAMLGGTEWPHKLLAGELAALLIAFPCFFYTNSLIAKALERNPDIGSSGVRRWLIYISLLFTATVLIGDAIHFLYTLLVGTFTLTFFLKILIDLFIMGGIFLYYLGSMDPRSIAGSTRLPDRDRVFLILSCTAAAISLMLGLLDFPHTNPIWADTMLHRSEIGPSDLLPRDYTIFVGPNNVVSSIPMPWFAPKILPTFNRYRGEDGCYIAAYSYDKKGSAFPDYTPPGELDKIYILGQIRVRGRFESGFCRPKGFKGWNITQNSEMKHITDTYFPGRVGGTWAGSADGWLPINMVRIRKTR